VDLAAHSERALEHNPEVLLLRNTGRQRITTQNLINAVSGCLE
jgi:hypothetical protein